MSSLLEARVGQVALVALLVAACRANTFVTTLPHDPPPAAGYSPITASAAEHELLESIDDARGAAGLQPLAWCDQVALIAHDPSETYDFGTLAYSDIRIVRATSESIAGAVAFWLASSEQRASLLAPNATHAGVAVTADGLGHVTATAVVVRVPGAVDLAALGRRIAATLAVRRDVKLAAKRKPRDEYRFAAQAAADKLAAGASGDDVRAVVLSWAPTGVTSVTRIVDAGTLADDASIDQLLHHAAATRYGVGVAQGKDRLGGRGAVWVVVVSN